MLSIPDASLNFPSDTAFDNAILEQYVHSGGNVYLFGGVDLNEAAEAAAWAPFLQAFGYAFDASGYNGFGPVPTLIEWDTRVPLLSRLLAEARKADQIAMPRAGTRPAYAYA